MNAGLACVSEFQTQGFGLVRCMQMECPRDANFVYIFAICFAGLFLYVAVNRSEPNRPLAILLS
jgi:hypothetical protein